MLTIRNLLIAAALIATPAIMVCNEPAAPKEVTAQDLFNQDGSKLIYSSRIMARTDDAATQELLEAASLASRIYTRCEGRNDLTKGNGCSHLQLKAAEAFLAYAKSAESRENLATAATYSRSATDVRKAEKELRKAVEETYGDTKNSDDVEKIRKNLRKEMTFNNFRQCTDARWSENHNTTQDAIKKCHATAMGELEGLRIHLLKDLMINKKVNLSAIETTFVEQSQSN